MSITRQELNSAGRRFAKYCLILPPVYCPAKKVATKTGNITQFHPSNKSLRPIASGTGIWTAIIHWTENLLVFDLQ
ncbi:MAG: hypothetical protein J7K94_03080 [Dehalococcoidia bacterium]|nr:hypothetical protein [Dehalococcoidia bacterium]